jgi:hypothetical protein
MHFPAKQPCANDTVCNAAMLLCWISVPLTEHNPALGPPNCCTVGLFYGFFSRGKPGAWAQVHWPPSNVKDIRKLSYITTTPYVSMTCRRTIKSFILQHLMFQYIFPTSENIFENLIVRCTTSVGVVWSIRILSGLDRFNPQATNVIYIWSTHSWCF